MPGQGAPPPTVVAEKYPGFTNIYDYFKHLKLRATELGAVQVTIPIAALDEAIENIEIARVLSD